MKYVKLSKRSRLRFSWLPINPESGLMDANRKKSVTGTARQLWKELGGLRQSKYDGIASLEWQGKFIATSVCDAFEILRDIKFRGYCEVEVKS